MNATIYRPGMDQMTGRCGTCDGRYCGTECSAREGYVYVAGRGWMDREAALVMEAEHGMRVDWHQRWSDATGWVVPSVKHPEGTPEYAAYREELKTELAKLRAGEAPYDAPMPW